MAAGHPDVALLRPVVGPLEPTQEGEETEEEQETQEAHHWPPPSRPRHRRRLWAIGPNDAVPDDVQKNSGGGGSRRGS